MTNSFPFEMADDTDSLQAIVDRLYDFITKSSKVDLGVKLTEPVTISTSKGKPVSFIGEEWFILQDVKLTTKNVVWIELTRDGKAYKVTHNDAVQIFEGYKELMRKFLNEEDEGFFRELLEVTSNTSNPVFQELSRIETTKKAEKEIEELVRSEDERFGSW